MKTTLNPLKHFVNASLFNNSSATDWLAPVIQLRRPGWQPGLFRCDVKSKQLINQQVLQLRLKPAANWPGFTPGQHIELNTEIEGRQQSRTFTISSSLSLWHQEGEIQLTIRCHQDGKFTPHLLSAVSPGDRLYISEAKGTFFPNADSTPLLLIAGGTGITPFASFLNDQVKSAAPVTLLHFAPTAGNHLFSQQFTELAQRSPQFRYLPLSTQEHGYLSSEILRQHLSPNGNDRIMVCGPDGLMKQARKLAEAAGIAADNVVTEAFSLTIDSLESGAAPAIAVSQNGISQRVQPAQADTLLNQLESAGVAIRSGCRMGVCHQCSCLKKSGTVVNLLTGKTSGPGEERIQACISQAQTQIELSL
ncbi:hypothetical protein C9I98_00930 [Photobacterium sanctipauli]|uniref:FAD-binding FR-type domain-containing protein n=1 Tax=Photobacterium sanctipauli TaxID=1342794 RepID=A0A2T3P058_9GAMM|nr:iron-sulfur cluster-binding domain-containing protein [Photobacterium sanctipauli]PSW21862.1 hypothetical protein C9I98_00930 [Photobacterium sanctipauli]